MGLRHALLSVLVGKDRGSCGVKVRVVIGVVEVPVTVNEVFHWSVAQAIENLFEPGPGGRNETVHHEFAVRAVEDYTPWTGMLRRWAAHFMEFFDRVATSQVKAALGRTVTPAGVQP